MLHLRVDSRTLLRSLHEDLHEVFIKIARELPGELAEQLSEDHRRKLAILQGAECEAILEARQDPPTQNGTFCAITIKKFS